MIDRSSAFLSPPTARLHGFTLIELMVVICIMGMIAAAVGLNVTKVHVDAMQQTARMDMRTLDSALRLYAVRHGHVPATSEGLQPLLDDKLVETVTDPWGNPYRYARADGESYTITCLGADGAPGGSNGDSDLTFTHQGLVALVP